MANYLGSTYKPATPRTDENFGLMVQVAQMKQSVYDSKKAQIQETLSAFGNIDVLRDQDKEYIAAKLNSIRTDINGYGNRDLSQPGVGDELMSKIKVAAQDPFIQNAMEDAYKFRSFQQTVAKKQEKNDGTYNDINYAYAMDQAGYDAYMRGDQKKLGNLQYRDYTDVNGELKKIAENLDKYAQVIKETTPDGIYYKTLEGKYLDKARIRNIAQTQLSDKAKGQMQINSWNNWERVSTPEQLTQSFNGLKQASLTKIDSNIASLETELKNTNNSDQKAKINSEIKAFKEYRTKKEESYNQYTNSGNLAGMAFELEQETLFENFASAYAPTFSINTSYSTNTAYFEQQKLEAKAAENAKKNTLTPDGLPQAESTFIPTTGLPDVETYKSTLQRAKDFDSSFKVGVNNLYNRLTETDKQAAEEYLNQKGIPKEGRESGLFDFFEELVKDSSNIISIQDLEKINEDRIISTESYKAYNESTEQAYREAEETGLSAIYKQAQKLNILDGQGNVIPFEQYMSENGIQNFEQFSQNEEVKSNLLKQYYADMALSDINVGLRATTGVGYGKNASIALPRPYIKENTVYKNRLVKLFGGDEKKAEEYIDKVRSKGLYDTNKIKDVFTNTPLGVIFSNPDNSFEDSSKTRGIINQSNIERRASKIIGESYMGTSDRGVRINAGSDLHKRMTNIVSDNLIAIEGGEGASQVFAKMDKNASYSLRVLTPEIIEVSQSTTVGKDPVVNRVQIYRNNIPQDIQAQINFGEPAEQFTAQTFPKVEASVKYNTATDIKRRDDLANSVFKGDMYQALQTTKEETLGSFFERYPQLMGTQTQPTEMGQVFKNIIQQNNLVLKSEEVNGNIYPSIEQRGEYDEKIFTPPFPIPQSDLKTNYKMMKYAPQIYVNRLLEIVAQKEMLGDYNEYYNKLKTYYGGTRQ